MEFVVNKELLFYRCNIYFSKKSKLFMQRVKFVKLIISNNNNIIQIC